LPELAVRLSAGSSSVYMSEVAADSLQHVFSYSLVVPTSAVIDAGLRVEVLDVEEKSTQVIAAFRLDARKLREAATRRGVMELKKRGQVRRYSVPHHEVDTSSCWKPHAIRVWDRAA
jgi:hypothetical protein